MQHVSERLILAFSTKLVRADRSLGRVEFNSPETMRRALVSSPTKTILYLIIGIVINF